MFNISIFGELGFTEVLTEIKTPINVNFVCIKGVININFHDINNQTVKLFPGNIFYTYTQELLT